MVRCHGQGIGISRVPTGPPTSTTTANSEPLPPELVKIVDTQSQNDYIALLLGDDDDQSADRPIVTFISVSENLQVFYF